jgi:Methyltransferase domain
MYDAGFYSSINAGSLRSARKVVPRVMELAKPQSVVDVGCGQGVWLSVFKEHGCQIMGLDGDYVRPLISEFETVDFSKEWVHPHRYGLAVSLEVAEHLPKECAEGFVDHLTQLSDVVLFSAAIPGQGGFGHVNLQWPSYWAALFRARDYMVTGSLRDEFWDDEEVEVWYRQNLLLCVKRGPRHLSMSHLNWRTPLNVVHPILWMEWENCDFRAGPV